MAENKLIHEKSPYLLQHADNPVHWYPWGEEAFRVAATENKPIFLSIGYSTCHWCHEMSRDSFEDTEVAALLNEHYIAIKVDREERPDIDAVYMKVCQMMTGQGGWPLTVVMTPEKKPFYAGTFFPKESKYGLPGMMDLLPQLFEKYIEDPAHIEKITTNVEEALDQTKQTKSDKQIDLAALTDTRKQLYQKFDPKHGGFGSAPKFPQPQNLLFLLNDYQLNGNKESLYAVEKTFQQMIKGGIYDHIGGGFARYSTDEIWLVPHFEKMLYDNALLLYVSAICYQVTKRDIYQTVCKQTIAFISREMMSKDGAFYSAIDADSEGVEGKYYVWGYEEVMEILGEVDGADFADFYGITPVGNFEGKNIPNLVHHERFDLNAFEKEGHKLLIAREKRVYPHVDDKILTSWNAMMIGALAYCGKVFHKEEYVEQAVAAMTFLENQLNHEGRWMARYRDGETKFKGYLDDYAWIIHACLDLYDATFEPDYLRLAKKYMDDMMLLFWDDKEGGFFQTGIDGETLITREKEIHDGALPSSNGVAAQMLTKLSHLTGERKYLDHVETMRYSFYEDVHGYSSSAAAFMNGLFFVEGQMKELVVIGDKSDNQMGSFLRKLQASFLPHISILLTNDPADFREIVPFATEYKQIDGKPTVYICENFACQAPTTDLKQALRNIDGNFS